MEQFAYVDIPEQAASTLAGLLNSPRGISVREAAAVIGVSRGTTHRYLTRFRLDGHAEIRGKGRGARFFLTGQARESLGRQPQAAAGEAEGQQWFLTKCQEILKAALTGGSEGPDGRPSSVTVTVSVTMPPAAPRNERAGS